MKKTIIAILVLIPCVVFGQFRQSVKYYSVISGGWTGSSSSNAWYYDGTNIYTTGTDIGIGIVPTQRLTVYEGGTETQLMLRGDSDQSSALYLGSMASDISGYIVTTHSTGRMDFGGTAGHTMVLDNPNKRVGIGTTSPSEVLHVEYSGPTKIQVKTTSASSYASFKGTCGTTNNNNYAFGQSYSTSGRFIASSVLVESEGSGGLGLSAYAGDIKFWTNGNNNRGSFDINGTFETNGGRELNTTTITDASYNLLVTDDIIFVNRAGAVTIDWKTAQMIDGRRLTVKDISGNASSNNITVTTEGAETIDGAATAVINSDRGWFTMICDGSNIHIIGAN